MVLGTELRQAPHVRIAQRPTFYRVRCRLFKLHLIFTLKFCLKSLFHNLLYVKILTVKISFSVEHIWLEQ